VLEPQIELSKEANVEISHWMTRWVHALKPRDSLAHARELLAQHRVNQLPVVVDGKLVGIITDRDVRDAFPSVFETAAVRPKRIPAEADPRHIEVETVMTADVLTLGPQESMAAAAKLMRQERVGAVPIVEGGRLVGIITRSDILRAFLSLSEATEEQLRSEPPRRSRPQ
jgi:acetoin utilization protein AcuB